MISYMQIVCALGAALFFVAFIGFGLAARRIDKCKREEMGGDFYITTSVIQTHDE